MTDTAPSRPRGARAPTESRRDIPARTADVIYTNAFTLDAGCWMLDAGCWMLDAAQAYYKDMNERAKRYGRSRDDILVMPA